jgi:hypothetical protein
MYTYNYGIIRTVSFSVGSNKYENTGRVRVQYLLVARTGCAKHESCIANSRTFSLRIFSYCLLHTVQERPHCTHLKRTRSHIFRLWSIHYLTSIIITGTRRCVIGICIGWVRWTSTPVFASFKSTLRIIVIALYAMKFCSLLTGRVSKCIVSRSEWSQATSAIASPIIALFFLRRSGCRLITHMTQRIQICDPHSL